MTKTLTAQCREPEKARLIDANALLEELKKKQSERPDSPEDWADYGFWIMQKVIESAPTVETTDDVLARFKEKEISFQNMDDGNVWCWDERKRLRWSGVGKTPIEALKKLEASLNTK